MPVRIVTAYCKYCDMQINLSYVENHLETKHNISGELWRESIRIEETYE